MEEWKLQQATRSSSAVFWANIDKNGVKLYVTIISVAWSCMLPLRHCWSM